MCGTVSCDVAGALSSDQYSFRGPKLPVFARPSSPPPSYLTSHPWTFFEEHCPTAAETPMSGISRSNTLSVVGLSEVG